MQEVTENHLKDKVEEQKSLIKNKKNSVLGWYWFKNIRRIINACCRCFFYFYSASMVLGVATTLFVADAGLTIADEVYQSIHNKSFMDEIMQPISDAVMEAIDKVRFSSSLVNSSLMTQRIRL